MTGERPILEADGLGKSFGGRVVLKSAAFSVHRGRITALMGRNGAGKTTMLRIAVGRVRPEWGRVLHRGQLIERPVLWKLARAGLMYVAQGSALTGHFTVRHHLESAGQIYSGQGRLEETVEQLRLEEVLDRRPRDISGGEKQRVSLAMATIRDPECLLMDEPFAGVAPLDRSLIQDGLRALRDRGSAILVTGHDVEDLFAVSDEIIWITAGTTHWIGAPREAGVHDQFRREYLGPRRMLQA